MVTCEFCSKPFKSKYTLSQHVNNAKYCLKLRGLLPSIDLTCKFCNKKFARRAGLQGHEESCNAREVKLSLNQKENECDVLRREVEDLKTSLYERDRQVDKLNRELVDCQMKVKESDTLKTSLDKKTSEVEALHEIVMDYKLQINSLEIKSDMRNSEFNALSERYDNICNTLANKTTVTTNSQYILMPEADFSQERLTSIFNKHFTASHLHGGQLALAFFVSEFILTKDGSLFYKCSDASRATFICRLDGEVTRDIGSKILRDAIYEPVVARCEEIYDLLPEDVKHRVLSKVLEIQELKVRPSKFNKALTTVL